MQQKTSIKIDRELNKKLSIFSLLEGKKKEEFTSTIIEEGLKFYKDKYKINLK